MERHKHSVHGIREKTINEWTRSEKRRWFLSLLFGTAAVYATRTSLPLLLPAISKEQHWSKRESGTLLSSFFWGYTLTQVIGGYLSDRIGGLRMIFLSASGWSLLTLAMPFIIRLVPDPDTSIKFIVFIRILNGAFQGVHFPSMISLTSQKLPDTERSSFFSALTIGSALGTLITGTLGSYCLEYYGWPVVFYVLGGLAFLWTQVLGYQSFQTQNQNMIVMAPAHKHDSEDWAWLKLLWSKPFWACIMAHSFQMNCFFVMMSWMPTYFHDTFPDAKGWLVNMVPWLFLIPFTLIAKSVNERLLNSGRSLTETRKIIQSICFAIQISGLAGLAGAHENFWLSLICSGLVVGATGFHNTAVAVNAQDLAPRHAGTAFGIVNTLGAVPGFLGVLLAGHLLHAAHSWPVVFRVTAFIDLAGWAVYVLYGSAEVIVP